MSESSTARRTYDNRTRQQKAAQTRERIVTAGSELVHAFESWNWRDLTFRSVAERAGAASSLLGFAPQFSAAILGAVVVANTGGNAWPATIAVAATAIVVLLFWIVLPRGRRNAEVGKR